MATVNIIIKGIAMIYHKEDKIWKILFPISDGHNINFIENDNASGISLAEANRQIQITAQNPSSEFKIGDNYFDFLDLTADYSHSNGVRLKDNWSENAVLMSIENAEMSIYEYTETEHMMLKENTVTLAPQRIGYSANAVIKSESVVINVNNHSEFPKIFEEDCTITFDNDCGEGDKRKISDFDLLYKVVEGMDAAEERYVVAKISENIDVPIFVGKVFEQDDDSKDPSARGLPCHLVRVSKPESLP